MLSDIDIAVLVHEDINKTERFDLRLRLSNELSAVMSRTVDLGENSIRRVYPEMTFKEKVSGKLCNHQLENNFNST